MIDRRVRPPVSVWLTIMIDKMATNRWLVVPQLTTAAPPTSSNHIAINFHLIHLTLCYTIAVESTNLLKRRSVSTSSRSLIYIIVTLLQSPHRRHR